MGESKIQKGNFTRYESVDIRTIKNLEQKNGSNEK